MLTAVRRVAGLAAVAAVAAAAGPAAAQPGPPAPDTGSARVPQAFEVCPDGSPRCPDEAIAEMYRRWRPLSNRCDHRAVFALTYLRTTEEFARTVKGEPGFFSDVPWINWEDRVFAELYFRPADDFDRGAPVPGAWRVAFEAGRSPDVTGLGDLLLGMNAHIQRDLPFTLAHVGLVKPDGSSRKGDHDKVNAFLDRVADPLQRELARRYDELFATSDAEPSPLDEATALQTVRNWRETAWRNAERLVGARSDAERTQVARSIDDYAEAQARSILSANTAPGYGATRDAHCRAHNPIELEGGGALPAPRLALRLWPRRPLRRARAVRVRVALSSPGRVRLVASVRHRGRRIAIARRVVRLNDASPRTVRLAMSRRGRRLTASLRGRRVRVRVTAAATAGGRRLRGGHSRVLRL